ncbi:MAG: 50S ribosomal protein L10 [Clostridia bacterium]|nr:50S ribosomal protein L10 [Clostridia bacterium]
MPNAKVLEQKKEIVNALVERLNSSAAGVFVTYSGLTVEKDTELRAKLREAGVEYTVVKNTLTRFAVNEVGYSEFSDILNGTTALATHPTDVVAPAKVLAKFIEDNKEEAGIEIKGGFMDGKISTLEEINAISKIPSKDTLYAMVACSLNATIAGFARAINAVKEQKEAEPTA